MKLTIEQLIVKQKETQEAIRKLLNQEMELTKLIENASNKSSSTKTNSEIKANLLKDIKKMGFSVTPSIINNMRVQILKRNNRSLTIIISQSSFKNDNFIAWFTLKPKIEDTIDFLVIAYTHPKGINSCRVLSNEELSEILKVLPPTSDGRKHIRLIASEDKVFEYQSKIEISNNNNNLNVLL